MDTRQSATTRVTLPPAHRGVVPVSAEQAGALYRGLRQLDQWQRASARDGAPVPIERECHTQSALMMVEPIAACGGEMSEALTHLLAALGLARLS